MRMTRIRNALVAVILLGCSVGAFAQQIHAQDRPEQRRSEMSAEEREEHDQRRRERMIWSLLEYLELSEDQSEKFMPILNRHFKQRETMVWERMARTRELLDLLKETKTPERTLMAKLHEIEAMGKKLDERHEAFLKEAEAILNARQYVKLAIFEERFKMRLLGDRNGDGSRDQNSPPPPPD